SSAWPRPSPGTRNMPTTITRNEMPRSAHSTNESKRPSARWPAGIGAIPSSTGLVATASISHSLPERTARATKRATLGGSWRALAAYDRWLGVSRDLGAPDQLANAASVHRWEYLSWHEQLAGVTPPAALERLHLQALHGLHDAARASQRLALGYRATTYASVC